MNVAVAEKLESLAEFDTNAGCWLWSKSCNAQGYGQVFWKGLSGTRVHRVYYEAINGPIPDGLHVCHKCDVRSCFNPSHMFLGTDKDNCHDKIRKGRDKTDPPRGSDQYKAVIDEHKALQIHKALAEGKHPDNIAKSFGIKSGVVKNIKNLRSWAWVIGKKNVLSPKKAAR